MSSVSCSSQFIKPEEGVMGMWKCAIYSPISQAQVTTCCYKHSFHFSPDSVFFVPIHMNALAGVGFRDALMVLLIWWKCTGQVSRLHLWVWICSFPLL